MRRRLAWLGAVSLLAALAWQLRPLIVWRLTVLPELLREGRDARLHVPTESRFPEAPPGWGRVEVGGLSFRAPLAPAGLDREACAACREGCRLPLAAGRLTVFSGTAPSDFEMARDRLAADAGDLAVFRSRERNWHTLRALADRAQLPHEPVETFRFEGEGGVRGVVARFENNEIERFVLYAWSRGGRAAPVVALSDASRSVALGLLGTLRIDESYAGDGASRCSLE